MHELGQAPPLTEDANTTMQNMPMESGVFATSVAPTLNKYCGGSVCHDAQSPTLGLALAGTAASTVRQNIVGQRATEYGMALIEPSKPDQSWLYRKLTGNFDGIDCSRATCTTMPLAGARPSDDDIRQLKQWIEAGATSD